MSIAWLVSKLLISVESLFFLDFFRFRSEFTILSIFDIIWGSTILRISIALWLFCWFEFSKFFEWFSSDSRNFSSKFLFWRRIYLYAIYLYMPKNHLRRLRPCATHSWNQKSATDFSNSQKFSNFEFSLNLLSWLLSENGYFVEEYFE